MDNIQELNNKLKELEQNNNYEDCIIVLEKMSNMIKNELLKEGDNTKRRIYEKYLKINSIKILENKLKLNPPKNMELYYRGHLIKELKEYKNIALPQEINGIRLKIDNETKAHREVCKDIRVNKEKKIPITKKLGLKIKEISDTIHLFLSKHDVVNKAKKVLQSTVVGGAFAIGIDALFALLMSGTLTPATIVAALPVLGYIGISSIVRNIITKTSYQNYQYKASDEYKELIAKFPVEHKEEYEEIKKLLEEKQTSNNPTEINNKLIALYDKIKNNTKLDEYAKAFKLEKHNLLLENKELYEERIDAYLDDKVRLSKKEYQTLMKAKLKNDIALFESENAIKEATKKAGKNTVIDTAVLVAARTIANFVIPGYKFTSISDLLVPLGYMVTNNLIGIITYKGKIRETKYNNKKVKVNNKEKLMELAHSNKKVEVAYAI